MALLCVLTSLSPPSRSAWVALAVTLGAFAPHGGCKTQYASQTPDIAMPGQLQLEALTRAQYEVLGPTVGEACAEFYGLWPLPIVWTESDGQRAAGGGHGLERLGSVAANVAARSALYKAVHAQTHADALVHARAFVVSEHRRVWYTKACVRVEGKGIRIREDHELSPAARDERPANTLEMVVRP